MNKVPGWVMTALLMLAAACSGPARAAVPTPTKAASPSPRPSASLTATIAPSASQLPSETPTATITSTAAASATVVPLVSDSIVVYRPEADGRNVATVYWASDGSRVTYALSPLKGRYLLDWVAFDLNTQTEIPAISPYPSFGSVWERMNLGYPSSAVSYPELNGFVSPSAKYILFPNAGFPNVFSTPNYIYVIPTESGAREPVVGPTFRGTVGKAEWTEHETKVIFDYRYDNGVEVFVTDLVRKSTNLLLDLKGSEHLHTEWMVAPNQSVLFMPGRGKSQIISLKGQPLFTFDSPFGLENPVWAQDSQAVYFWDGNDPHLMRYILGETQPKTLLALSDLMSTAPVKVVRGMPFSVSPDEKQVAFWWKNWIWVVRLDPN